MENKNNLILNRQNLIVPLRLKERLPRILVDQDDVLAMFIDRLVKEYNRRFGTQYTAEDCKQWNLEKTFGKQVWDIVLEKGFFRNLKPVPEALETFERLYTSGRYDMFIVTASEPQAYVEKVQWLEQYMPYFDVNKHFISCKSKDAVWGDILLDDGMHNIEAFYGIGESVIYDRPHNQHFVHFKRVHNWLEFEQYVEQKFYSNNDKICVK